MKGKHDKSIFETTNSSVVEHFRQKIKFFIQNLIPSCYVTIYSRPLEEFEDVFNYEVNSKILICENKSRVSCSLTCPDEFVIYLESFSKQYIFLFRIKRNNIPYSRNEKKLLYILPHAIANINVLKMSNNITQSIMMDLSFGYFVLANIMCIHKKKNKDLDSMINFLNVLQTLTFQRYESKKCTSGFIYINNLETFLREFDKKKYTYTPFDNLIKVDNYFFEKPASYRYVDGKNNFYIVTDGLECSQNKGLYVLGIFSINNPEAYNILDRCYGKHALEIVHNRSIHWVVYVGFNNDIFLFVKDQATIKWEKNIWHSRDKALIENLFNTEDFNRIFARMLSKTIIALSELRMGSLILIKRKKDIAPEITGRIDDSIVGQELYDSITKKSNETLETLSKNNKIIGILSSDGLTVFDKEGVIKSCGDIINLNKKVKSSNVTGGGRTQAALIASHYGFTIKISEDGPISFFKKGRKIIEFK